MTPVRGTCLKAALAGGLDVNTDEFSMAAPYTIRVVLTTANAGQLKLIQQAMSGGWYVLTS